MGYRIAADAVLILHLAFILFVVLGSLAVLRWPRLAWLHLPAAAWGAALELNGWICPLTPLENSLLRAAGESGYTGGFIEHYLIALIYPAGLTPTIQLWLGAGVLAINLPIYAYLLLRQLSVARKQE
ncbi:DUF2784 domain-containing protein [Halomonas sp. GXIMD04776]|uniref:DUF2784 domain-containing protein n=1 Tax=Halomonas sp. GXIMD04776 TaxID=3415605 RepID=UPI003C9D7114